MLDTRSRSEIDAMQTATATDKTAASSGMSD